MAKKKCCVRVDVDFTVSMRELKKGGIWKDRTKEYLAGEWLNGYFVESHGSYMFRSGKFLLSPIRFDRIEMDFGAFAKLGDSLSGSLGEIRQDCHDMHGLFV